ncbi:hypothetical protein BX600DRAFT_299360 [Xylariales sp. PMI_506]|nr:hypothetical protein BX600DRAFT_299360 [Xylariales sp. PMI_506]
MVMNRSRSAHLRALSLSRHRWNGGSPLYQPISTPASSRSRSPICTARSKSCDSQRCSSPTGSSFPFGINGAPARTMSESILTQLETTRAATQQVVRCTDLPLLVACLELEGQHRDKWIDNIVTFVGFSPQFGKHVRNTLVSLWAVLDMHETISWNDLMAKGTLFLRNAL